MTAQAAAALERWDLSNARATFVAGRENEVYRVDAQEGTFALRLRRPGYRSAEELQSELQWLQAMADAGLNVPQPLLSRDGALIESVQGRYVDLVNWLDGTALGKSREALDIPDPVVVFRALGLEIARLHDACDAWEIPDGFQRCRWDIEGLVGADPHWGRFWENPSLDIDTRELMLRFKDVAGDELRAVQQDLDFGLIHADLVRENVMLAGDGLAMIDFDDGGWGFRAFDIATALLKNRAEANYPELQAALIAAYRELRPFDDAHLPLFMALRAVTYVGWITERMAEPGSVLRNKRFIEEACTLCSVYLKTKEQS